MTAQQQPVRNGPPIKEGAIFGALSFLAGYLVTLVVLALGESEEFTEDLFESAGWLYYNAQFADVEFTATAVGESRTEQFNFLTDETLFGDAADSLDLPALAYHLIPIIVLVVAGFAVARYVNARGAGDGAVAGATIVVGVVVLALLGTFVFAVESTFFGVTVEGSPDLIQSGLLVGIVYPAVFGALGGVLGAVS